MNFYNFCTLPHLPLQKLKRLLILCIELSIFSNVTPHVRV
jgi:hypothetical protein